MKKIFSLFCLSLLLCLLCGCGLKQKDDYQLIADLQSDGIFLYEENLDGGITVRSYLGEDTEVTVPASMGDRPVTRIGVYCFRGNETMTAVTLPDTLMTLEQDCFRECASLRTVILPASLTRIEQNVFKECTALSEITLPEGLTYIGKFAFEACSSLKHVTVPGTVTHMGDGAFWKSGLETLTLSEGITEIGSTVFAETQLRELTLPSTMKILGWQSFMSCQLTSVTLNEGLTTLEGRVFSMNRALPEIVIPSTVTTVTDRTFSRCDSLSKIFFEGNAPEIFFDFDATSGSYVQVAEAFFDIYYHEGAEGFTTPEWFGYQTILW